MKLAVKLILALDSLAPLCIGWHAARAELRSKRA